MKNQLTVLSCGGGQDSIALLCKYIYDPEFRKKYAPNDFIVVMSDTGDEHPETYKYVEHITDLCKKHNIEFHFLTKDKGYHRQSWPSLIEWQKRTGNIVMLGVKSCTDNLKIVPIYKFLDEWVSKKYDLPYNGRKKSIKFFREKFNQNINVLIGISKGEEKRVKTQKQVDYDIKCGQWKSCITTIYPLIDLGLDRQGCQEFIKSTSNPVPPPSNCMRCPYMNDVELLWLNYYHPGKLIEWADLEETKMKKFANSDRKNCGVFSNTNTIWDRLGKAQKKHGHLSHKELDDYKFNHGCVNSKY